MARDLQRPQEQGAPSGLKVDLAQDRRPEVLHVGLDAGNAVAVHADQRRVVRPVDPAACCLLAEPQFDQRAGVFLGAGGVEDDLETAAGEHFDVPGDRVVGAGPVRVVGVVRVTARPLDGALGGAVARREMSGFVSGMADRKRPVVLVRKLGQYLGDPGVPDGGESGGRLGPLRGDVVPLARVDGDVEQAAFVIEPVPLTADAGAPVPVVHEMPFAPSAGRTGSGLEQWFQAEAVDGVGGRVRDAGEFGQSRQQVDRARDPVDDRAGFDGAWPADEEGGPDAAFIRRTLATLHAAVPAPAVRAVVRQVDDDRVQWPDVKP